MPIIVPIVKRKAIGERTAWTSKRKINRIETLTQKYKKEMINSMTNEEAQEIPTQPLTYYYFSTGARVQLTVWNKLIDFLVDTEAIYSVLNIKATKKSSDYWSEHWSDQTVSKTGSPSTCGLQAWVSKT